ncbi:hypothetical protein EYC84_008467 [Monilinia fructicola]|uniref:Uncharacterized protein n=1 Tax=Monilinia fructicola TaxID=38448 RepID=A0A5M9JEP0_MONFR|nr:hypothetical protein EYC84_008467 [Monilinia fructicola]
MYRRSSVSRTSNNPHLGSLTLKNPRKLGRPGHGRGGKLTVFLLLIGVKTPNKDDEGWLRQAHNTTWEFKAPS